MMTTEVESTNANALKPPDLASPARLQRLANKAVNNLGLSLVDIAVEPREDGRISIVLPEAWAYIFLAHLEATAKQIHGQLRRAMYQARMKDARLQGELQKAAREWEEQRARIRERYWELVREGLSMREAIRKIKAESTLTATEIQSMVQHSEDPRKKQARQERNQRIRALRKQGMTQKQIAAQVGTPLATVKDVLKRERRESDGRADRS